MSINPQSLILIVDDSAAGREVLSDALETEGYALAFAAHGVEALAQAELLKPDLILLDIMMPGMDGYEVCQRLRASETLREVPVVMVTAINDRASKIRGLTAGADDFISKPFDRLELRARARTITRLNRFGKLREEHARLMQTYAELLQTHGGTLAGWVMALDLRDKETEGHSQRVVNMTVALARAAEVDESAMTHLQRGALLHDIGKLGIPDAILLKAGPLTSEERAIMCQHPQYARDWLSQIPYLQRTIDIPYSHHERWDGAGYPQRLKGEQTPLAARLFALADVWDALRSNRPYRSAWSEAQALEYIQANSGSHFDPACVELFCTLLGTQPEVFHMDQAQSGNSGAKSQ